MNTHQTRKSFLSSPASLATREGKSRVPYEKTDDICFRGKKT